VTVVLEYYTAFANLVQAVNTHVFNRISNLVFDIRLIYLTAAVESIYSFASNVGIYTNANFNGTLSADLQQNNQFLFEAVLFYTNYERHMQRVAQGLEQIDLRLVTAFQNLRVNYNVILSGEFSIFRYTHDRKQAVLRSDPAETVLIASAHLADVQWLLASLIARRG